jgi:hypothetical protein
LFVLTRAFPAKSATAQTKAFQVAMGVTLTRTARLMRQTDESKLFFAKKTKKLLFIRP